MAGYIYEFFGYRATDKSKNALHTAASFLCPFLGTRCTKILSRDSEASGVCSIRQKKITTPIICCPIRLYAENYKMLSDIANLAFNDKTLPLCAGRVAVDTAKSNHHGAIAVFGHGWGGELRLPKRNGTGSYFCDWVLARLDKNGDLKELTAAEVQTIDTTGNYRTARQAMLQNREIISDTVGLNWENVSKRIIPQLIYKGQVLQREDLCKTGLFFIAPQPIFDRVLQRLGGRENLPAFPMQPASINFISYNYTNTEANEGDILPIGICDAYHTTVYKVQEAFSAMSLPNANVYRDAIEKALYE